MQIIKNSKRISIIICLFIVIGLFSGCETKNILDPKNPVTLTLWHNYGQQMNESMNKMVDEFNGTVGEDKGVIVRIAYVADTREINERLIMAANKDPGAPVLPDIAIIYPRIGVTFAEMDLLADISAQFTAEELATYIPAFLEEGKLGGDAVYIIPIAKSTEVLYVNATIFDRFAAETGVDYSNLATFEGIADAAEKYYEWSGGKAFFYPLELFNYAMIGFQQIGEEFITGGSLNFSSPVFQRVWDVYYPNAVKGGAAIFDNYGNYLMASGEIVCVLDTSAGVTFYPETVTYSDNTKEICELAVLPQPVFENGENIALQRGGGMCVFKSNNRKEYAAGIFIKWLTTPEQNLRFTEHTGYMPVTVSAFDDFMAKESEGITNDNVRKLREIILEMQKTYTFYFPPVFDGFEEMQRNYNQTLRAAAENSRREYLRLLETQDPTLAYESATRGVYERFTAGQ